MAISSEISIRNFSGLSTDLKPDDFGIGAGSRFTERDTGIVYKYDGNTWYVETQRNYLDDISRGKVTGAYNFYAYGEMETGGPVTDQLVWPDGVWTIPDQAGVQASIVSDSVQDTNLTGTGAWTIELIGLDTNYNEQREIIELNGTTPVLSVNTNYVFFQCVYVQTYGAGKAAAGNISIGDGVSLVYSYIAATDLRCSSSARMVPAGKRLLIYEVIGSSTSGTAAAATNVKIAASKFESIDYIADSILIPFGNLGFQDNSFGLTFKNPIPFYEGTVVGMTATTDKAAIISGSWYGNLENV